MARNFDIANKRTTWTLLELTHNEYKLISCSRFRASRDASIDSEPLLARSAAPINSSDRKWLPHRVRVLLWRINSALPSEKQEINLYANTMPILEPILEENSPVRLLDHSDLMFEHDGDRIRSRGMEILSV